MPGMDEVKQKMRAAWMAGDFGVIARTNAVAAEQFAVSLGIPAGAMVLDIATGTGNVAIPLALEGCVVTGVDIAPNLLDQARERAAAAGVEIALDEGDAEALPYADSCFDVVVTMFGAMFAPRPEVVAAEMARVLRPGGLLAMANWNPESFSGAMFRTGAKHAPGPPGVPPPVLWGDEDSVRQRLGDAFCDIETEVIAIDFDLPMDPVQVVDHFRRYFGPSAASFARLDAAGQQALHVDLVALWSENNVSADPWQHTLVRNQYLQVTATRTGG